MKDPRGSYKETIATDQGANDDTGDCSSGEPLLARWVVSVLNGKSDFDGVVNAVEEGRVNDKRGKGDTLVNVWVVVGLEDASANVLL